MRNLYIFLTTTIILTVLLIASIFVLFEKERHQSFFYVVEVDDEKVGYIKIDRYKTEDKIIYKSTSYSPKEPDRKITHEKLIFDRENFILDKWIKEYKNFDATTEATYIKNNKNGSFNFLTKSGSKFSIASDIVCPKDISIFDIDSIVTYIVFIDKYNFSMGGAQSFNAIYHLRGLLPPARGKVIFTSQKDDYINVDGKKTKTEYLTVRAKALPEIYVWALKKDGSIAQLKNKSTALLIKKVAFSQRLTVQENVAKSEIYDSQDIIFPSGDIGIAGTIVVPGIKKNILPAVLLVAGESPYNRENSGLYTDICQKLAQKGYIVLRFDRRGIGGSQGNNMELSLTAEIKDIESALAFLLNHEKVDKDKIFIIAHGESCSYLSQLDFSKFCVKGLVMLGIKRLGPFLDFDSVHVRDKTNLLTVIDNGYLKILDTSKNETSDLIKNMKKEYAFVQRIRIFPKRMSQLLEFNPLENITKLKIPILIIHGKKDRFGSSDYLKNIEEALKESGFQDLTIIYFRDMGHFFGELINEKNKVKYYRADKEVLETISEWLDDKCFAEETPEPQKEGAASDNKT